MNIDQARIEQARFVSMMEQKGCNDRTIRDADWMIGHLLDKFNDDGIDEVCPRTLREVTRMHFGVDILDRADTKTKATVKSTVSKYWAFCSNGAIIAKTTIYPKGAPEEFKVPFMRYCDHIDTQQIADTTKTRHKNIAKLAFCHLSEELGVHSADEIEVGHIRDFAQSRYGLGGCHRSLNESARIAMFIDWLSAAGYTEFDSRDVFPYGFGRSIGGKGIPSYYSLDELRRIFSVVETSTPTGKRDYLVLCLLAILGMRIGDIISLLLTDIDWAAGKITKVQKKTGGILCLPLVEPVRGALLDYLDAGRPETDDPHLLIRELAPFVGYTCISPFTKMVTNYMQKAGIDTSGRHHGCHALRHSMAGGMLAEGATIGEISDVLGHRSVESTKVYLSFDQKVMKKIGLEVPDVKTKG